MSWIKIDDALPTHPKIVQAGAPAAWLYVCGLAYAGRYLTDGFIPQGQVRLLADVPSSPKLAARLVTVGLWQVVDGGYQIHDYLEYQPSRERALATRDARSQAGAKGGQVASHPVQATSKQPASKLLNKTEANEQANSEQPASILPGRSRIDPRSNVEANSERENNTPRAREPGERLRPGVNAPPVAPQKPLPRAFPLTEEMRVWAAMDVPALSADLDRQHKLFCAHYHGTGEKRSEWRPVWEAWMLRALKEFAPRGPAPAPAGPARRYLNGGPDNGE